MNDVAGCAASMALGWWIIAGTLISALTSAPTGVYGEQQHSFLSIGYNKRGHITCIGLLLQKHTLCTVTRAIDHGFYGFERGFAVSSPQLENLNGRPA